MGLSHYFNELFEPTILFGITCGLLGVVAAWHYKSFELAYGALAVAGVALAHMSVNLIDDYEDYSSGLDKDTVKTKFSGGNNLVAKGHVKLQHLLILGLILFAIAGVIGLYLILKIPLLLPIVAVGAITVLFYAKYLSKVPFLAEPLTALNFALVAIGCFIASGGLVGDLRIFIFAALAVGIQVGIVVLVNYMPDRVPDKKHGRRNVVVMINDNKKTASLYLALESICFLLIIIGITTSALPITALIVFLTVPTVLNISKGISHYKNPKSFEKYMGSAVMAELGFIILLVIAYVI